MKRSGNAQKLELRWVGRFASIKDVTWHTHADMELVAVTKGRCRIQAGECVMEGVPGTIFILPAKAPQYQVTFGMTHTTYLGLDLPPGFFNESARVVTFDPADPVLQWVEHLCDGREVRPPLSNDVEESLIMAIMCRLDDMDTAVGLQARFHPAVQGARAFLEANLSQAPTLATLAQTVGVSASHLSALFAAQCGVSPMRYLQRLRMQRACWLLSNSYLRIQDVSEACGYEDVNYFTRLFHRSLGISPGRWRTNRLLGQNTDKPG